MSWPDTYAPLNGCRSCGRDFTSVRAFDLHRIGTHAYSFTAGLRLDPAREDGRRCADEDEMTTAGLARVEVGHSPKYDRRIRAGVSLYWDPGHAEQVRSAHSRDAFRTEGTRAVSPTPEVAAA